MMRCRARCISRRNRCLDGSLSILFFNGWQQKNNAAKIFCPFRMRKGGHSENPEQIRQKRASANATKKPCSDSSLHGSIYKDFGEHLTRKPRRTIIIKCHIMAKRLFSAYSIAQISQIVKSPCERLRTFIQKTGGFCP